MTCRTCTHGTHGPQWVADEIRKAEKMTDKIDTSPEQLIKNAKRGGYAQPNGRLVMVLADEAERLSARVTELEAERDEQIEWVKSLADDVNKAEQRAAELEAKLAKVTGALAHEVKRSRRHLAGSTLATLAEIQTETKENDNG